MILLKMNIMSCQNCKWIALFILFNFSCSNDPSKEADTIIEGTNIREVTTSEVEVMVAKKQDFNNEIVSNGRLYGINKTEIRFILSEITTKIFVQNGQFVHKGDVLVAQENFNLKNQLNQMKIRFAKAKLDLTDLLLGQGYDIKDTAKIDKVLLETDMVKSGYAMAKSELELAEYHLQNSTLTAPISARVANLFVKEKNYAKSGDFFCDIVDNSKFEVLFPVMESEIGSIKIAQKVLIYPYFDDSYQIEGFVKEMNPMVDKNGLVTIKAIILDISDKFFEGMNVKVFLKSTISNKIVVPKEAVTLRSDKPVVFTYKDSLASWNYIKTGSENQNSIVVEDGIKEGDTIIFKGNINLGHNARVTPMNLKVLRKSVI